MNIQPRDYIEIMNLYSRYNICSDSGDALGYADCFTEQGLLQAGDLRVVGRAELVVYKREEVERRNGLYRRHWNGTIHVNYTGDNEVQGACYLHAYNGKPTELPYLAASGVYDDRIVRTADGWLFLRRELTMD